MGWGLLTALDLPVFAAVLVGLVAAFLPPRPYWWAQLAAVGLPYAAAALAALTVVWLLGRRWWAVGLHVVLLALVLGRAGVPGRLSAPVPADGDLAVVTFNVPTVGASRETLGDSVAAFARVARPDLAALQDAWVYGATEDRTFRQDVQVEGFVEAGLTLAVPARMAGHPGWRENATGVPVLVGPDVEVIEQEAVVLGVERDPDVSLALRTRFRWNGREAVLYNVHLRSFGETKPWNDPSLEFTRPSTWRPYMDRYRLVYARRGDEADEIADEIDAETLPVIVAGDFNSTADNWSYRRLRTAGGVSRADAFQSVGGGRWGRTYRADRPFVRIDFVLADPAFEVTSAQTTAVTFSDHRPVRVTLRWRGE